MWVYRGASESQKQRAAFRSFDRLHQFQLFLKETVKVSVFQQVFPKKISEFYKFTVPFKLQLIYEVNFFLIKQTLWQNSLPD